MLGLGMKMTIVFISFESKKKISILHSPTDGKLVSHRLDKFVVSPEILSLTR
jgi:hypothetical protein